jgi:hypothetical protein
MSGHPAAAPVADNGTAAPVGPSVPVAFGHGQPRTYLAVQRGILDTATRYGIQLYATSDHAPGATPKTLARLLARHAALQGALVTPGRNGALTVTNTGTGPITWLPLLRDGDAATDPGPDTSRWTPHGIAYGRGAQDARAAHRRHLTRDQVTAWAQAEELHGDPATWYAAYTLGHSDWWINA